MTDKEKILAEINRRIDEIKELGDFGVTKVQVFKELLELQVFVDSLPSEPASSVDMSLQEKKNLIASLQKDIIESIGKETMIYQGETYTRVYKDELDEYACKYPKSIPLPSKKFRRYSDIDITVAIKAGANWQREKLPKWEKSPTGGCWSGEIAIHPTARLFRYEHYVINADELFELLEKEE